MGITLRTKNLILESSHTEFAEEMLQYYLRNKEFLEKYEPKKDASFYTYEYQYNILEQEIMQEKRKAGIRFYITQKDDFEKIIGSIALSNIIWGAFRSCFVGYKLDKDYVNRGYMTEAVNEVVNFAFNHMQLHRIEGNIMPRNTASLKVLEKCGFVNEGLAKKYLKINGVWEDHIHMVRLNEKI